MIYRQIARQSELDLVLVVKTNYSQSTAYDSPYFNGAGFASCKLDRTGVGVDILGGIEAPFVGSGKVLLSGVVSDFGVGNTSGVAVAAVGLTVLVAIGVVVSSGDVSVASDVGCGDRLFSKALSHPV